MMHPTDETKSDGVALHPAHYLETIRLVSNNETRANRHHDSPQAQVGAFAGAEDNLVCAMWQRG